MLLSNRYVGMLGVAALLCGFANALPTQQHEQVVLSSNMRSVSIQIENTRNSSFTMNNTFDDIDLAKVPNKTLTSLHLLEFKHFELINTTSANASGLLAPEDMDCATTKPNAIHNIPLPFGGPSIFKSNATALAAVNTSQYFDFISFSAKPLGPTKEFSAVFITAWEIDGKEPKATYPLSIGWGMPGYQPPFPIEPREYFPGWGERVNWVEIEAVDGDGTPLEFCVDDIVLEFYDE